MKLMLGTAQFGVRYGTFNKVGKTPLEQVSLILDTAESMGIEFIDTARVYGDAEVILGNLGRERFQVISKCPDLSNDRDPISSLQQAFKASEAKLDGQRLYGYLLHNAMDLLRPGIWDELCKLRDDGKVVRIGVSAYEPEEVVKLCDDYALTLLQLPANILDPWYDRMMLPDTVEVHVRSAFLQGFLLSDPNALPHHLQAWRKTLEQFHCEAMAQGLTPLEAALGPLLASDQIDKVVVGVDSAEQLSLISNAVNKLKDCPVVPSFGPYPTVNRNLTNPRLWRLD